MNTLKILERETEKNTEYDSNQTLQNILIVLLIEQENRIAERYLTR